MKNTTAKPSATPVEQFADWTIRHRWGILLLTLIFTLVAGYGARNIEFLNNYRIFFSEDNPQLQAFDELQQVYTKDDAVLFTLTPASRNAFDPQFLEAVEWTTAEAWKLPFVTRVDSITNFQNSVAEEDDLYVDDLITDPQGLSEASLASAKKTALSEPLLANRLITEKAYVTGVNATMTFPEKDITEGTVAAEAARDLENRIKREFSGVDVHLTGMVMMNNAFSESSMIDMQTIIPLMYLGIIITMIVLLRSYSSTISVLTVIVFTTIASMGLMGWFGIDMSPPVSTAPTMIMTLAIADSIHILVTFLREMRLGQSKQQALIESIRVNFTPVFLTSITTCIGFLSMNFSDAPPFRDLGNVVAIGVMVAWVLSIVFLPALISILPVRVKPLSTDQTTVYDRLADMIISARKPLLWGSVAVIAGLGIFIPRIELNDQWVNYFEESIEFRTDTDYTMEHLAGIYTIEYSIPAGESGGINNPEYLKNLDAFSTWYRSQPGVKQVVTISDTFKRLNKNMHADNPEFYQIPESRELAAQYLLLYEMSLPYGLDLNNTINVDKSATRLIVSVENLTTREIRDVIENGANWLRTNTPEYMHVTAASPSVMFAYISERNIKSMIGGTLMAIVLISVVLTLALRSYRYGAISLLPNLIPAIMGFGAWSLLEGIMGLSLSVVTGMTLGIVVDDTVHFLTKYIRARREKDMSAEDAVRYAFHSVGRALVVTTIILVVGFSILS
ncbi:MAG: MMPL family transporter, partial [Verrucomicrobiae bacterium]|nr:MMPL family transporter [Verrucomicrobiae bacterium]